VNQLTQLFSEWTPATYGIFSLLTVAVVTLIKAWPVLALQATTAKEKLREEGRTDLSECKERLDRMGARLDSVYEVVNNLKIELSGVLSAYRVLEVAEEIRDPRSLNLAQARAILNTAFTVAPSTAGYSKKSETLQAAEETCHAAEVTVDKVKRDEGRAQ
jgi:hypothetical protein